MFRHDNCYLLYRVLGLVIYGTATENRIPGALYHVIARGNQRQRIFLDDSDRKHYLSLLLVLKKTCSFRLYTYVLMHNHVHMLVETGTIPLSRIMQRLIGGYTQYFNAAIMD